MNYPFNFFYYAFKRQLINYVPCIFTLYEMSLGQSEKALEEMPEWHLFVKAVASDNVAVVLGGQRFRSCS